MGAMMRRDFRGVTNGVAEGEVGAGDRREARTSKGLMTSYVRV